MNISARNKENLTFWCIVIYMVAGICFVCVTQPADFDKLGFSIDAENPDYGQVLITNVSSQKAQDVRIRIMEDFSYAGKGNIAYTRELGHMEPGEQRIVTLSGIDGGHDIGRLDVWLQCNRGKAYFWCAWSYAMNTDISTIIDNYFRRSYYSRG